MHLKHDADLEKFLSDVRLCSSEVYFETAKGDSLTLRSTLSQYIFRTMACEPETISAGTIRFSDAADMERLLPYLEE